MNKVDEYLKQFVIQFSGLKNGRHDYTFEIGPLFFERFKIEDVNTGEIQVKFSLTKRENMLELEFEYDGFLSSTCDRCLDPLNIPVSFENDLRVKFGDEHNEENDELLVLAQEEYKIDIAPLLYEFISLHVPLRKVHDESDCNEDIISRLQIDTEAKEDDESPSVWDKLKNLN